jgi:hypothetical protein
METLRGNLSDTVNELNKLLRLTHDPDMEAKLRRLRRIYFALWEEVIRQDIDNRTPEFKDAIESLQVAHAAILEAKEDIETVANAINRAVAAAKTVDLVVNLGIDLLA